MPQEIHRFINGRNRDNKNKGKLRSSGKFQLEVRHPVSKKDTYIGTYKSQQEVLKYWVITKHVFALDLADTIDDPKLKQALSQFYIKATFGLEY